MTTRIEKTFVNDTGHPVTELHIALRGASGSVHVPAGSVQTTPKQPSPQIIVQPGLVRDVVILVWPAPGVPQNGSISVVLESELSGVTIESHEVIGPAAETHRISPELPPHKLLTALLHARAPEPFVPSVHPVGVHYFHRAKGDDGESLAMAIVATGDGREIELSTGTPAVLHLGPAAPASVMGLPPIDSLVKLRTPQDVAAQLGALGGAWTMAPLPDGSITSLTLTSMPVAEVASSGAFLHVRPVWSCARLAGDKLSLVLVDAFEPRILFAISLSGSLTAACAAVAFAPREVMPFTASLGAWFCKFLDLVLRVAGVGTALAIDVGPLAAVVGAAVAQILLALAIIAAIVCAIMALIRILEEMSASQPNLNAQRQAQLAALLAELSALLVELQETQRAVEAGETNGPDGQQRLRDALSNAVERARSALDRARQAARESGAPSEELNALDETAGRLADAVETAASLLGRGG